MMISYFRLSTQHTHNNQQLFQESCDWAPWEAWLYLDCTVFTSTHEMGHMVTLWGNGAVCDSSTETQDRRWQEWQRPAGLQALGLPRGETQQRKSEEFYQTGIVLTRHNNDLAMTLAWREICYCSVSVTSNGLFRFWKTHLLRLRGLCPHHHPCLHCLGPSHLEGPRPQVRAAFPDCHGKGPPHSHHIPSLDNGQNRKKK